MRLNTRMVDTDSNPDLQSALRITRLAILILLGIFLTSAIILFINRYQTHIRDSQTRLYALTEVYAENFLLEMGSLESIMLSTSAEYQRGVRGKALHEFLVAVAGQIPQLRTVVVIDPDGIIVADSRADEPAIGIDVSDRAYFQVHVDEEIDDGHIFIDDAILSRADGTWSMPMTIAIREDDGSLLGVVIASLEPTFFSEPLTFLSMQESHSISGYIVNTRGNVLTSIPYEADTIGTTLSNHAIFDEFDADAIIRTYRGQGLDSTEEQFIAFARVGDYELCILFAEAIDDVLAEFYHEALLITIVFLLVSSFTVFTLSYQFRRTRKIYLQSKRLEEESQHRQRAEQEARKREIEFRTLVENTQDIIVRFDKQLRHVYVNPAVTQTTGIPIEDYIGKTNRELGIPEELVNIWDREINKVFETGENNVVEFDFEGENGRTFFQARLTPELDESGIVQTVLSITRDFTTLREAERLRLEVEQERELLELKEQFIARVSHDFRTPLSVINSSAEMLERYHDRMPAERQLPRLQQIQRKVQHMVKLIDDVLKISKFNQGKILLETHPIEVEVFCRRVWEDMMAVYATTHKGELQYDADIKHIIADEDLLEYALVNILSNAFKYTSEQGKVIFHINSDADTLTFRIQDSGYGIPEDDLKQLFTPFFRASNVGNIEGTGLGLVITKNYVELHQGSITVDSELDQGTTFVIKLPVQHALTISI